MLERLVSFLPDLCFGLFMNIYVNILNIVRGGGEEEKENSYIKAGLAYVPHH